MEFNIIYKFTYGLVEVPPVWAPIYCNSLNSKTRA